MYVGSECKLVMKDTKVSLFFEDDRSRCCNDANCMQNGQPKEGQLLSSEQQRFSLTSTCCLQFS